MGWQKERGRAAGGGELFLYCTDGRTAVGEAALQPRKGAGLITSNLRPGPLRKFLVTRDAFSTRLIFKCAAAAANVVAVAVAAVRSAASKCKYAAGAALGAARPLTNPVGWMGHKVFLASNPPS